MKLGEILLNAQEKGRERKLSQPMKRERERERERKRERVSMHAVLSQPRLRESNRIVRNKEFRNNVRSASGSNVLSNKQAEEFDYSCGAGISRRNNSSAISRSAEISNLLRLCAVYFTSLNLFVGQRIHRVSVFEAQTIETKRPTKVAMHKTCILAGCAGRIRRKFPNGRDFNFEISLPLEDTEERISSSTDSCRLAIVGSSVISS